MREKARQASDDAGAASFTTDEREFDYGIIHAATTATIMLKSRAKAGADRDYVLQEHIRFCRNRSRENASAGRGKHAAN